MTAPWLSDDEVAELCSPLEQSAAQARYLRDKLHLHVERKPNGRPLVMRSELERVAGAGRLDGQGQNATAGPNVVGLQAWAKGRRERGQKAQG